MSLATNQYIAHNIFTWYANMRDNSYTIKLLAKHTQNLHLNFN